MKSALSWVPGTVGGPGYASCFFGLQWIFAILAPSGKGRPLPATPALRASIIVGFPRITATTPPFSLIAIADQSSYPLNSENASPPGTCTAYLSWAEMALPPNTASTAAMMIAIAVGKILVMAYSCQRSKPKSINIRQDCVPARGGMTQVQRQR